MICKKCKVEFEPSTGLLSYCSLQCRNSRTWSKKHKKLLSIIAQRLPLKRVYISSKIVKHCICGKDFLVFPSNVKRRTFCSKLCYLKNASMVNIGNGGYRRGSGIGKHGWYKGYWCDSSWELAYVIYCLEHQHRIERNIIKFSYIFDGIQHHYFPDFIVDGNFVEIKGYVNKQWYAKLTQFPKKINVIGKIEMQPILKYVIEKYGNDFLKLYE